MTSANDDRSYWQSLIAECRLVLEEVDRYDLADNLDDLDKRLASERRTCPDCSCRPMPHEVFCWLCGAGLPDPS